MTAEAQILQEIRRLREDFAKLKQAMHKQEKEKEKEQEQWVTADVLIKKFGVNRRQLAQYRKQEVIRFRVIRARVVRYLLASAEQFFADKKASHNELLKNR